jgi:outer membrane lipoprotein-sorting protein
MPGKNSEAGMRAKASLTVSLFCFLLFAALSGFAADQKDHPGQTSPETAELLARLGKKASDFTTLKTDFVQEKELALFQDKLVLKGRIYLRKPNRIAWHVDEPVRYSVLITDTFVRQWDAETNKVQELSLAKNPVFQSVLGQLTVWFSGEYTTLLKDYTVRVVRHEPVVLECSPREHSISRKVIKSITLTFRADETYLQTIRIQEHSGDATTIDFLNTVVNPRLDEGVFEVQPLKKQGSRTTGENGGGRLARESSARGGRKTRVSG